MVYQANPYLLYFDPLPMLYRTPCQLFFTPPPSLPILYQIPVYDIMSPCTNGIPKTLPMLYRPSLPMVF